MLHMLLLIWTIYENVIEVDHHKLANKRFENLSHQTHEGARRAREAKRHDKPFVQTLTCFRGCFPFIARADAYLVISAT